MNQLYSMNPAWEFDRLFYFSKIKFFSIGIMIMIFRFHMYGCRDI
jgi:hypothetical protein